MPSRTSSRRRSPRSRPPPPAWVIGCPLRAWSAKLTTIIGEESDRLEALVSDATQMLRLSLATSGCTWRSTACPISSPRASASWRPGSTAARCEPRAARHSSLPVDGDLLRVALRHLAWTTRVNLPPAGSTDHRQRVGVGRRRRDRGRERRRAHPGRRAIGDLLTLLSRKRGPQRPRQRHGAGHRPSRSRARSGGDVSLHTTAPATVFRRRCREDHGRRERRLAFSSWTTTRRSVGSMRVTLTAPRLRGRRRPERRRGAGEAPRAPEVRSASCST